MIIPESAHMKPHQRSNSETKQYLIYPFQLVELYEVLYLSIAQCAE